MLIRGEKAREQQKPAGALLKEKFPEAKGEISSQYVGLNGQIIGVSGLKFESPFTSVLLEDEKLYDFLGDIFSKGKSIHFSYDGEVKAFTEDGELNLSSDIAAEVKAKIEEAQTWGGI